MGAFREEGNYQHLSTEREILETRHITFKLDDVKFFNNSSPAKHFVSDHDGSAVCEGGPGYCRQVTYSPKNIGELANPKNREILAREVIEKFARVGWKDSEVKAVEIKSTTARLETEDLFYLSISAKIITEQRSPLSRVDE